MWSCVWFYIIYSTLTINRKDETKHKRGTFVSYNAYPDMAGYQKPITIGKKVNDTPNSDRSNGFILKFLLINDCRVIKLISCVV